MRRRFGGGGFLGPSMCLGRGRVGMGSGVGLDYPYLLNSSRPLAGPI